MSQVAKALCEVSLKTSKLALTGQILIKQDVRASLIHISKKLDCETSNHNGERKEIN